MIDALIGSIRILTDRGINAFGYSSSFLEGRSPSRNCSHEPLPFVEAAAKPKLGGSIETQPGAALQKPSLRTVEPGAVAVSLTFRLRGAISLVLGAPNPHVANAIWRSALRYCHAPFMVTLITAPSNVSLAFSTLSGISILVLSV